MVLLKNDGVLPLSKDHKVGLVGPAASTGSILGGWHCAGQMQDAVTVEDGLRAVLGDRLITAATTAFSWEEEDIPDEAEAGHRSVPLFHHPPGRSEQRDI